MCSTIGVFSDVPDVGSGSGVGKKRPAKVLPHFVEETQGPVWGRGYKRVDTDSETRRHHSRDEVLDTTQTTTLPGYWRRGGQVDTSVVSRILRGVSRSFSVETQVKGVAERANERRTHHFSRRRGVKYVPFDS